MQSFIKLLGGVDQLFYWKAAGVLLTSIVGLIGLFGEFKNKQGKLTSWGKINLFLLILGTVVGVGSEAIDSHGKLMDSERTIGILLAQSQQLADVAKSDQIVLANSNEALDNEGKLIGSSRTMLHQVDRSINVIRDVTLQWTYELPLTDPTLKVMNDRVMTEVAKVISSSDGRTDCGQYLRDGNGQPIWIYFYSSCSAIPHADQEGRAESLAFYSTGVSLQFYKSPIPKRKSSADATWYASVDPVPLKQDADHGYMQPPQKTKIFYDMKKKVLFLQSDEVPATTSYWNSGKITAIPDLEGSHLQLSISDRFSGSPRIQSEYERIRSEFRPRNVALRIAGQTFNLQGKLFVRSGTAAEATFRANIPESLDSLRPMWVETSKR